MGELFATFGIDWRLLIIQAVNFGIVLVVLRVFLWKPVMRTIDERKKVLAKGVEDAAKAEKARAEVEAKVGAIVATANRDAEAIVARATDEGKREREAIVKAANDRADQVRRDAEAQAAEAQRRALQESEKEIARTAVLAAEKILAK